MELIDGVVRCYEWGSRTVLAELLGRAPSGESEAELWLGANPVAPARLRSSRKTLDEVIASDPVAALGAQAAERFDRLPFLMKVLAVDAPLSLQAHPSAEQAASGYDLEEALGVPRDAAHRVFRDRNHKPEMVCALSRFEALCGFRDPADTLRLIDTLPTPALDPLRQRLRDVESLGWPALLRWLLTDNGGERAEMVVETLRACTAGSGDDWAHERRVIAQLGALHAGDPAVVAALLLNRVVLEPGEAMFVGAGRLHAYLHGTVVEVMADSDNTLRGGLTAKAVDTEALMAAVENRSGPVRVQRPAASAGVSRYEAPVAEFSLMRIDLDGSLTLPGGPAILLCCSGRARAGDAHEQAPHRAVTPGSGHARAGDASLTRGDAAWVGAKAREVVLQGQATIFRAGLGALA